jgi:threonine/homoserine/homoserine lactone efflux protein
LALFGSAFLLWMAWRLLSLPPASRPAMVAPASSAWQYFAGTFALTLSNPATIFSFIAVFGAMGARTSVSSPGLMVLGVLVGSALWWVLLSGLVGRLRGRFGHAWRRRINRGSAAILAGFAAWQLLSLVKT